MQKPWLGHVSLSLMPDKTPEGVCAALPALYSEVRHAAVQRRFDIAEGAALTGACARCPPRLAHLHILLSVRLRVWCAIVFLFLFSVALSERERGRGRGSLLLQFHLFQLCVAHTEPGVLLSFPWPLPWLTAFRRTRLADMHMFTERHAEAVHRRGFCFISLLSVPSRGSLSSVSP